jgi:preprotein translocase subunit YajC
MQPGPSAGAPAPSSGSSAPSSPPAARPDGLTSMQPLLLMAVMFGVFYFLLIRPQQKRQRETDAMLKALRKGDKVRTSGGIRGEVIDLTDTEVNLLVADKVKINVLRSHIASRITPETKEKA